MTIKRLRPSFTFTEERLAELRAVVPEAFADGRVNWEALKEALGEWTEPEGSDAEHFGLFWPGKREARRLAAKPSRGTLVPVPGEGVNEETTRNLFIEGDNLEVLKLLQKSYAGRVKMIYIDPPYNTGNDFVYKDDFRDPLGDYLRKTGQVDDEGKPLSTNTRSDGRFHSNWLSMMYPRIALARQLLRDDGVMFVSIDDVEVANLRHLLDSVFGPENFVGTFIWRKKYTLSFTADDQIAIHEYILAYKRGGAVGLVDPRWGARESVTVNPIFKSQNARSTKIIRAGARFRDGGNHVLRSGQYKLPSQTLHFLDDAFFKDGVLMGDVRVEAGFAVGQATLDSSADKILVSGSGSAYLDVPNDQKKIAPLSILLDYTIDDERELYESYLARKAVSTRQATDELQQLLGEKVFDNPKPTSLLTYLLGLLNDPNALVLDFFAGSGTTAHAVMKLNAADQGARRFICIQLPEPVNESSAAERAGFRTIAEITKERLRRASGQLKANRQQDEAIGFRTLRLTASHFRAWEHYDGDSVEQLEALFDDADTPLIERWSPDSLLSEILLLQGFPLDAQVESQYMWRENDVRLVTSEHVEHRLWVCLDRKIHEATVSALTPSPGDVVVCLDSALSDEAKLRLADRCTLETI